MLTLHPVRAGPDHQNSGLTLALLGSGRQALGPTGPGPALGQCKRMTKAFKFGEMQNAQVDFKSFLFETRN